MKPLTRSDFDFAVPDSLIAQSPMHNRSQSKLLIAGHEQILHENFQNFAASIPPTSLVVMNQSKVIPARLFGQTAHAGKLEIFLLEKVATAEQSAENRWRAIGKPMRKLRKGAQIFFADGLVAEIVRQEETTAGAWFEIQFPLPEEEFFTWLAKHGSIPLPPYIKRASPHSELDQMDRERYQTVYAKIAGSVAAPTAGLHFTPEILRDLRQRGIDIDYVTLHVGAGTFLPVKQENLSTHTMHEERYSVPASCLQSILRARSEHRPIILVGTTTLRTLESFFLRFSTPEIQMQHTDQWLQTDLFIYPKTASDVYHPQIGDALLTNFHQPCSTLFMLVCALLGYNRATDLYQEAIAQEYRLFSYGDASLLWL